MTPKAQPRPSRPVEWPTLALILGAYGFWSLALFLPVWLAVPVLGVVIALHSSLQHEVIHGHPFRSEALNTALIWPPLTIAVPYLRFRDTHLAHHRDAILTDPYDDPESNYLDPAVWDKLPGWVRMVLGVNNTLAGRILIGPLVGQVAFMAGDLRAARAGDRRVIAGWLWHLPAVVAVLASVAAAPLPIWAYLLGAYVALGVLKIRTFLEHQAHEKTRGRTVIVEDRGPLAFLFLNNNLHVVHHMHPRVPWYQLPRVYARNPRRYGEINEGYRYASYGEIFRRYFLKPKDAVPHPLWGRGGRPDGQAARKP